MTNTTRRAILAGVAASIPAAALGSVPALAAPDITDCVEALWRELETLKGEGAANLQALGAAHASLPRWADVGPEHMDHNGNRCGPMSRWPEMENPKRAASGPTAVTYIRRDPSYYKEVYEYSRIFGEKTARRGYRANLRRLVARKREQKIEKERCGIPALKAESDRLCEATGRVEEKLEALAPLGLNAGAAALLIQFDYAGADDRLLLVLRSMLPHLTGLMAQEAAAFIAKATDIAVEAGAAQKRHQQCTGPPHVGVGRSLWRIARWRSALLYLT